MAFPKSDKYLRGLASKREGYTDILPGKKKKLTMYLHENVSKKPLKKREEAKKAIKRIAERSYGLKGGGMAGMRRFNRGGKV